MPETEQKQMTATELYAQLAEEAKAKASSGSVGIRYRGYVTEISDKTGEKKLVMPAVIKLAKQLHPNDKIDRSYFINVIEKAWETEKDAEGVTWILVDKPKTPVVAPTMPAAAE
ncbi:MAG: hypothetical protein M0R51_17755 [Clostridia bacterium]|jgi:hypothetical protein|nr:hypothetical protein [Clostridia bacterium]